MTTTYVFYGEDRRHIEKGATAYHGFRLDLTKSVDLGAIKAKATAMAAAPQSDLRIRIVPPALFTYTPAADADVLDALLRTGDSGLDDPAKLAKQAEALWAEAMPIRVWVTGKRVDLLAHHAVFDGVRGVELLNELMGNADKAGTVARRKLPSCIVACGPATLVRVLTCDRQKGTLGACRDGNHHESHYLHLPTAAVKRAKATHNLGFAAALQARAAQLGATRRNSAQFSAQFGAQFGAQFSDAAHPSVGGRASSSTRSSTPSASRARPPPSTSRARSASRPTAGRRWARGSTTMAPSRTWRR